MPLVDGGDVINTKVFIAVSISAILLVGCVQAMATPAMQSAVASGTPTVTPTVPPSIDSQDGVASINLQVGSKQVTLTLVQNNQIVPIAVQDSKHGEVSLVPDTFTIRLEGDKEYTYIAGLIDQTPLLTLESYRRPLATFDAGYVVEFMHNKSLDSSRTFVRVVRSLPPRKVC